jgi:hypothetical protein
MLESDGYTPAPGKIKTAASQTANRPFASLLATGFMEFNFAQPYCQYLKTTP